MRFLVDCEVSANEEVGPDHFRLHVHAPQIAENAQPGQFCMLEVADGFYPFLRRPMCFERILSGGVTILYKVGGYGTQLLSKFLPGQTINIQGPLGNGFPVETHFEHHILVSGGIGVASFPALAQALAEACGHAPEIILAARTKDFLLCEEDFRSIGCAIHLATDDGSAGEKALASQVLERLRPGPRTRVYACGPMAMMRAISEITIASGVDCLVSLEAQMACGDGACLGCVVESRQEREGEKMVRVCLDGPVFDTTTIDWEAHNLAYST
jgi:dihydroorotate dehydrogenase electron transfer subunit